MRLLMTADTVGGVWTYCLQLIKSLQPYDVEVHLATQGGRLSDDQRADAQLENLVLHESTYQLEWMPDPWQDVERAGRWLLELAADIEADLIHLNDYSHAVQRWRMPVVVIGHSCVLSWHRAVRGCEAGAAWNLYRRRVAQGLRAADLVIAPTRFMLEELEQCYGPLGRTECIANGIDPPEHLPTKKRRMVFAAGRMWDDAKNLATLCSAAERLHWPLELASLPDPQGGDIRSAGVVFKGRLKRQEMQEAYRRAAVFAHPARYEPFGLTPLEAAGHGCALVLSGIPSLYEVWRNAALYVDPDDPVAWAAVLNALLEDDHLRKQWARRAYERALQLTADDMAEAYYHVYRRLVPQRTAGQREQAVT